MAKTGLLMKLVTGGLLLTLMVILPGLVPGEVVNTTFYANPDHTQYLIQTTFFY